MNARPRRGLPPEEDEPSGRRRLPRVLVGSTALSALCLLISYLVWGPAPTTTQTPTTPPPVMPTSTATPTEASPSTSAPSSTSPSVQPLPTQPSADPVPTGTSPDGPPEVDPGPTAPPAGTLELDDTSFTAPAGWTLYGDDLIEDDRRMVRLSHMGTDTRLQVVSLLVADEDLQASCRALMDTQGDQFALTSEQLALPMGMDASQGLGVTCGFSGVRLSDGHANTVTFSLVRRASDGHVLMLRHTVPDAVPLGDPARRELVTMSCQASTGFGAALPLC